VLTLAGIADLTARLARPLHRGFKPAGYDWAMWAEARGAARRDERAQRAANELWIASMQYGGVAGDVAGEEASGAEGVGTVWRRLHCGHTSVIVTLDQARAVRLDYFAL
jgi:hypothetical protein